MAKDSKSRKAQDAAPPDAPETAAEAAAEAAAPGLEPPQSSDESNGANAMTDAMPSQEPPAASVSETSSGVAEAMPTLSPEDAGAGVQAQGGVAAWLNNKRVSALWTINQNRNSWVYITGVGWKKLANNSDTAVVALTTLAASAKLTQTNYSYREEADGMIHESYVW